MPLTIHGSGFPIAAPVPDSTPCLSGDVNYTLSLDLSEFPVPIPVSEVDDVIVRVEFELSSIQDGCGSGTYFAQIRLLMNHNGMSATFDPLSNLAGFTATCLGTCPTTCSSIVVRKKTLTFGRDFGDGSSMPDMRSFKLRFEHNYGLCGSPDSLLLAHNIWNWSITDPNQGGPIGNIIGG